MLWPAIDPGLRTFYDRTIAYQAGRDSPFSIWGQVSLEPLRIALLVGTGALSLYLAFRPREKSLIQVAALGAALLIAVQLTMQHWFYLYIVWFYPLLVVALASDGSVTGIDMTRVSLTRDRKHLAELVDGTAISLDPEEGGNS
jgi:hypothetical protein